MSITKSILEGAFLNPFDEPRYSHEDYNQFSTDALGKIKASKAITGLTQAQIDALESAIEAYQATLSSETFNKGSQKGSTQAIEEAWAAFLDELRRKEGLVKAVYGKDSIGYNSFFPQGLNGFSRAKRGEQLALIDAIEQRFTEKAADFPGVAAGFTALKANYLSAASSQAEKKGDVKTSKSSRDMARLAVANNFHELWLSAAIKNMGKPEVAALMFDPSIFDKGTNYDNDGLGRLRLQILDVKSTPLINAKLNIHSSDGTLMEKGITDENGYYESADLAIGFYNVTAAQDGFNERISNFQVFDNKDPLRTMFLERN